MLANKARAYPSEAPVKCTTPEYSPELACNRLGRKNLLGSNNLGYCAHSKVMRKIKSCKYGPSLGYNSKITGEKGLIVSAFEEQ